MRSLHHHDARWYRLSHAAKVAAGWRCQQCGNAGLMEAHHIHPVRLGGEPYPPLSGLLVLCRPCHLRKHRGTKFDPAWDQAVRELM